MTTSFPKALVVLIAVALGATVVAAACMYLPASRWGGSALVIAVAAGCVASFVSGCVGNVFLAWAASAPRGNAINYILGSTVARILTIGILLIPLIVSDTFHRVGLVVGAGVSYLLMLLVDSFVAVRLLQRQTGSGS